jgi:hypothetical protein
MAKRELLGASRDMATKAMDMVDDLFTFGSEGPTEIENRYFSYILIDQEVALPFSYFQLIVKDHQEKLFTMVGSSSKN